jgi:hypothetical protein
LTLIKKRQRSNVDLTPNLAISPEWWEKLDGDKKEKIIDRATTMSDIFSITEQSYLMEGLKVIQNGISKIIGSKLE